MSHHMTVCPACNIIWEQCRCPDPNKEKKIELCPTCLSRGATCEVVPMRKDYIVCNYLHMPGCICGWTIMELMNKNRVLQEEFDKRHGPYKCAGVGKDLDGDNDCQECKALLEAGKT